MRGQIESQSSGLRQINSKAFTAALIPAGHGGASVAELLLDMAFVQFGGRGEARAQGMSGEFALRRP